MITPLFLHYLAAGTTITLAALGAGIGLGIAGFGTLQEMMRQPLSHTHCFRAMLIGLALIESGAIIALVMTIILLIGAYEVTTLPLALAELGTSCAVGIAAATIGLASSFVVKGATQAIAREPNFSQKIITLMLVTQSIIEAPVMFAFIISLMIRLNISASLELAHGLKFLAIGTAIGIGCVGPSIGQSMLASSSCFALGRFKNAYARLFPFTLLSQAIIETPMAFCLLFSFLLIYTPLPPILENGSIALAVIPFALAALLMGFASLGPGIGMGYITSKSIHQVAQNPSLYQTMIKTTLVACAFLEASLIYALIIGLFLITGSTSP